MTVFYLTFIIIYIYVNIKYDGISLTFNQISTVNTAVKKKSKYFNICFLNINS